MLCKDKYSCSHYDQILKEDIMTCNPVELIAIYPIQRSRALDGLRYDVKYPFYSFTV